MAANEAGERRPGSVEDVVARLSLWAKRSGKALCRAEYVSEPARDRVIAALERELASAGISFHRVLVSTSRTPAGLAHDLVQELRSLGAGVVSITGFTEALGVEPTLSQALRTLNYYREDLAVTQLRQIWWMPESFAESFVRTVPDLDSWFLTRIRLTELAQAMEFGGPLVSKKDTQEAPPTPFDIEGSRTINIEDARDRARGLVARLERSIQRESASVVQLRQLAAAAVGELRKGGAVQEADQLEEDLVRRLAAIAPAAKAWDFFISYSHADRAWAQRIWTVLTDARHTVIWDQDFRPGSNIILEMQRAMSQAARTIAVLSPDYLSSRFAQSEWAAAFYSDPIGARRTLLPVRVRDCDPTGLLGAIAYVDLVGLSEEEAKDALLAAARGEHPRPSLGADHRRHASRGPAAALPTIWSMPHRRNPNFTGREDLLQSIEAQLGSSNAVVIAGMGGIGKTQLAVEYAYRHVRDYGLVWWIPAAEPVAAAMALVELAEQPGLLFGQSDDHRRTQAAVQRWLTQNGGWLLIFDEAEDPAQVRDLLPRSLHGHVLITSRHSRWRELGAVVSVPPLTLDQSVEFLRRRSGDPDAQAARAMAEELGGFPLALEQAAAYVESTGASLQGYLELFRTRRQALWKQERPPAGYPRRIDAIVNAAIDQLRDSEPAATDLVSVLAFLAPDNVPRWLFESGARVLPERLRTAAADPIALNRCVAALGRQALINSMGAMLSTHNLVQLVVRDGLGKAERQEWASVAVKLVDAVFPVESEEVRTGPLSAVLLPHAVAAAGNAAELGAAEEEAGSLLHRCALYLLKWGQFLAAKLAGEKALELGQKVHGPEHHNVAAALSNLGDVLRELGDFEGALAYQQRALAVTEAALGAQHESAAYCRNQLAATLRDVGRYEDARTHLERAVSIAETTHGGAHPLLAQSLGNLGVLWQHTGDLSRALECHMRAVEINARLLGTEHPAVAVNLQNIGSLRRALGDLDGAQRALVRALEIHAKAFGPEHPSLVSPLNNLGAVLSDLGRLDDAEEKYRRALRICESSYGMSHPQTAQVLNNLGILLGKRGDRAGELELLQRALAIDEAALGADHPDTAMGQVNLGAVLERRGELDAARDWYRRALKTFEQSLGYDQRTTVMVREKLASLGG